MTQRDGEYPASLSSLGISNPTLGVPVPSQADTKQAAWAGLLGLRPAACLMPASGRVDGRKYVLKTKGLGFKAILLFFPLFNRLFPP